MTCFGISLDGEAAFPNVDREIQVRELYSVGERGDLLSYSRNTYTNTESHMKQSEKLSRRIEEHKGNRQGHVRASGHYKAYLNPCLVALNDSNLGFSIGPISISAVSVADDTYLLASSPRALQAILNIADFFAKRYRIIFNADKTKLIVTGSAIDMDYYKEINTWHLGGESIIAAEDNEHLGLIVSGTSEEQKNVDGNIQACRNSLFGLLGPAFAFKCLLPPTVQIHLWQVYNLPVLCSGLGSLPIRSPIMKSLTRFHNKILRGFLKLSHASPIPALHFLLGELPVEARVHMDTLSVFYNIWANPNTTAHKIVHYILRMADEKSVTWAAHLRMLCLKYDIPDPLKLLDSGDLWSKLTWSILSKTRITVYFESMLRQQAATNSKMNFLNVKVLGLSGTPHPALLNITTTQDVLKLRPHLKLLSGDLLTRERESLDTGSSPQCKLCHAPVEDIEHVLVHCSKMADIRAHILPEILNTVKAVQPGCAILVNQQPYLAQFILDCTSLNLPEAYRIPAHHPNVKEIFRISRHWCHATTKLLKPTKI